MTPEEKIRELGIQIPRAPVPLGSYIPSLRTGNLIFLSGILPLKDGKLYKSGKVGENLSLAEAQECAKIAVINALSALKTQTGTLDRIHRCVKVTGYIASAKNFFEQPQVMNAASDLLYSIFGESGRHVRSAIGASVLPLNAPIEIEFIFEVSD